MNQKNIFSAIAVVLMLQGVAFYIMGDQVITGAFPDVADPGHHALKLLMEVVAALSVSMGLIAYACRSTPGAVWAFTLGIGVLLIVTLKHVFVDHINVPIPAIVIQVLILLSCGYLWSQEKKVSS